MSLPAADMRKIVLLIIGLSSLVVFAAQAELYIKRSALIIGQQRYDAWPETSTSEHDALKMKEKLTDLGFVVTLELNLTQRGLVTALNQFAHRLDVGSVGLIYYSGHGMQGWDGFDYLIPVDAPVIEDDVDLRVEAVRVATIEDRLFRLHGDRLLIVLLDMSRTAVGDRAIAPQWNNIVRPDSGQLDSDWKRDVRGSAVLFSTAPGETAIEMGQHSVFTEQILKALEDDLTPLSEVFTEVSLAVSRRTNGRQNPWRIVSLRGIRDFYFHIDSRNTNAAE